MRNGAVIKKIAIVLYLAGLHAAVAALLVQGGWAVRLAARLGWREAPNLGDPRFVRIMLDCQRRQDGNIPDGAAIFIGDSLVQGLCVAAVAPNAVNLGIAGDTTAGVLQRLPAHPALARAGLIVLAVGINDVGVLPNREIARNWEAIAGRLPPEVPVIFCAVLPVDERVKPGWRGLNRDVIQPLNRELEARVRSRPGGRWVDAGPRLADAAGQLRAGFHDGDGLHLNSAGNAVWIAELRAALAAAAGGGP